jgi:glycine cleavage system H protein
MPDFLELTADKFVFKVATDRLYSKDGLWFVETETAGRVRIGVSDFIQQHSGDVAFVTAKPAGTRIEPGGEVVLLETIKTILGLNSPIGGIVAGANEALETTPELVNQEPYGRGWLTELDIVDWPSDRASLLNATAYFAEMNLLVQEELKSL